MIDPADRDEARTIPAIFEAFVHVARCRNQEATDVSEDPFAPNSDDMEGPFWDPWIAMGVQCGGYSAGVDLDAIEVLRAIRDGVAAGRSGGEYGNFVTDIAERTGLSRTHVELYQYMFCSVNWCDYGTSPRGCFPEYGFDFDGLIEAWCKYYVRRWGQEPSR